MLQFATGVQAAESGKGGGTFLGGMSGPIGQRDQTGGAPVFWDLPIIVIFRALDAFGVDST